MLSYLLRVSSAPCVNADHANSPIDDGKIPRCGPPLHQLRPACVSLTFSDDCKASTRGPWTIDENATGFRAFVFRVAQGPSVARFFGLCSSTNPLHSFLATISLAPTKTMRGFAFFALVLLRFAHAQRNVTLDPYQVTLTPPSAWTYYKSMATTDGIEAYTHTNGATASFRFKGGSLFDWRLIDLNLTIARRNGGLCLRCEGSRPCVDPLVLREHGLELSIRAHGGGLMFLSVDGGREITVDCFSPNVPTEPARAEIIGAITGLEDKEQCVRACLPLALLLQHAHSLATYQRRSSDIRANNGEVRVMFVATVYRFLYTVHDMSALFNLDPMLRLRETNAHLRLLLLLPPLRSPLLLPPLQRRLPSSQTSASSSALSAAARSSSSSSSSSLPSASFEDASDGLCSGRAWRRSSMAVSGKTLLRLNPL